MMGQKALEAAQILVDDLNLHGQLTPEACIHSLLSLFCTAAVSAHAAAVMHAALMFL